MNSIASAKRQVRDFHGALEALEIGQHILERMGTTETENGFRLFESIGRTRRSIKYWQGAMDAFKEARKIREKMKTLDTPEGAKLLWELEDLETRLMAKSKSKGKGKCDIANVSGDGKAYGGCDDGSKGVEGGAGSPQAQVEGYREQCTK